MSYTAVDRTGGMYYTIDANEPVSMAVIRAVSALNGCDPCSMRSLTDIVDPDALDALFAERNNEEPRLGGRVSFVYEQCRVTVKNGKHLTVRSLETRPQPAGDGELDAGNA